MKAVLKLLSVAAFAAVVAIATPAFALEAAGKITAVDVPMGTITLGDGQTFKLSDIEFLKSIKLGDQVTVEYMMDGTMKIATAIKIAA